MPGIREQKLLYHLTSIENLSSIFHNGLRPRAQLDTLADVADAQILSKRKTLGLERYVPFHWLPRTRSMEASSAVGPTPNSL